MYPSLPLSTFDITHPLFGRPHSSRILRRRRLPCVSFGSKCAMVSEYGNVQHRDSTQITTYQILSPLGITTLYCTHLNDPSSLCGRPRWTTPKDINETISESFEHLEGKALNGEDAAVPSVRAPVQWSSSTSLLVCYPSYIAPRLPVLSTSNPPEVKERVGKDRNI